MKRAPKKAPPRSRSRAIESEVVETNALAIPKRDGLERRDSVPPEAEELLSRWLSGKSVDTRKGYLDAARHFARFLCERGYVFGARIDAHPVLVVSTGLSSRTFPEANVIVERWIQAQREAKNKASTIATRCSAVRQLCRKLAGSGMLPFVPDISAPKVRQKTPQERARLYEGVPAAFVAIVRGLGELAKKKDADPLDVRDHALCRMGSDMGLRRIELVRVDLEELDLDKEPAGAMVHGKGRDEAEEMTVPGPLVPILRRWIKVRAAFADPKAGPLFVVIGGGRGHTSDGGRIGDRSTINHMLKRRARQFGVKLKPHDLRRIFCTDARRRLGPIDALPVTRHASADTLALYDLEQGKRVAADADAVGTAVDDMVRGKKGRQKR